MQEVEVSVKEIGVMFMSQCTFSEEILIMFVKNLENVEGMKHTVLCEVKDHDGIYSAKKIVRNF